MPIGSSWSCSSEQLKVNPQDAERQGDVASCYAILGDKENAVAHLSRSLELGHSNKELLFNAAVVFNDLGETGVALEWLQKALTAGYSASIVRDSPSFDNLRNESAVSTTIKPRAGEINPATQLQN